MKRRAFWVALASALWWMSCSMTAAVSLVSRFDDSEEIPPSQDVNVTFPCLQYTLVETEYVILENGSLLLPQNQHMYGYDSYQVDNNTAYICTSREEVLEAENTQSPSVNFNFSKEFLSCGHILIDPHEFVLMKNGTVFIKTYGRIYEPSDYYLQDTGVYVCLPNFHAMLQETSNGTDPEAAKFSEAFAYVTITGLAVSIVSLLLHLLVFCCVSKVRNLPGCCLASLSLSLLLAYLCFISSSAATSKEQCADIGLSVYYFFLTSFFWMNSIAFDLWRSFRVVVRELRISSHRVPWRRFLFYSMYSWLVPGALVALARVADHTDLLPEDYRPSFGSPNCWFGQRKALLVFFATPLCLVMLLNTIFFLDSSYVINVATMKTVEVNEMMIRRRFFMFMRLALLMGLTWIVGIVAGWLNKEAVWFVFIILNTLQGLFIFIAFSCSSKVRAFLLHKLGRGIHARQSTSVRTISQASGAL